LELEKLGHCRIIDGSLGISSIEDERIRNLSFSLLTEIAGTLKVHNVNFLLSIGSLFPNLAVIRGNSPNKGAALEISDNKMLSEIGLKSLRFIGKGNVRVVDNPNLCFAETIDWSVIAVNATENEVKASISINKQTIVASCFLGIFKVRFSV
jgi:insulin receptor